MPPTKQIVWFEQPPCIKNWKWNENEMSLRQSFLRIPLFTSLSNIFHLYFFLRDQPHLYLNQALRAVLYVVPCRAVPCRAVPCRAVPCRAVPCRAVPCRAVPCQVISGRFGTARPYKPNFSLGSTKSYHRRHSPRPVRHDWLEFDFKTKYRAVHSRT